MAGNNNGRLTNAIGESLSPAAIKLTVPPIGHGAFGIERRGLPEAGDGFLVVEPVDPVQTAIEPDLRLRVVCGDGPGVAAQIEIVVHTGFVPDPALLRTRCRHLNRHAWVRFRTPFEIATWMSRATALV